MPKRGRHPKDLLQRLPICLVLLALSSCAHPVQRTLEGRWMGESVENFDDEQVAAATGWARGASMEFAGRELTVAIPAEEPRTAEYEVVSVRQSRVNLRIQGGSAQEQLHLILDDEQSLRWMLDDSRSIVMRRQ